MKLRTKTLLVICTVSFILCLTLSVTLDFILSSSYSDLEIQTVSRNVERVLNQFTQEFLILQRINYGWSLWDDTYSFINDTNEDYIKTNLQYGIFYDININFMLFFNNSDALIFSKAFDFNQKNETNFPNSFNTYIIENKNSLLSHPNFEFTKSGIILYDENEIPLIISANPIVHTNGEGPVGGTLIIGRFFDNHSVNSIGNIMQLNIAIYPLSNQPSKDFGHVSSCIQGKPIFIQPINSTFIAGYFIMDDVFGNPVFIVEVGLNRDIYTQGQNVIQNLIISMFIIVIVFIVIIIIIFDRFVTSRLTYLTKSVNDVKNYDDLSKHLQVKGNDEIAMLEKNINDMLTSLQKTWAMKDSAEFSLQKKIDELERFKTITVDREIKMIELKKQLEELKTKSGEKT